MKKNFVLIIGAMKCGTSSLFYYLSEHPEIAPSKNKEPHFFSHNQSLFTDINRYQALWDWKPENKIAMEASTTYTMQPKYPNIAERIASVAMKENATFRFIYIMRNPFRRIESHIRHLLSEKIISAPKLIEEHINFTEYAMQLKAYVNAFGRDKLHLLLLEDLQQNPQLELSRICRFLDIDPDYEFQKTNVMRNSKDTLNLHPVIRQIYKMPAIKSLGNLISPQLRQKLYRPLSRQDSYQVKLSKEDKLYIVERLRSDLLELEKDYGIDLASKWGIEISTTSR
jgi:hypothetical protein